MVVVEQALIPAHADYTKNISTVVIAIVDEIALIICRFEFDSVSLTRSWRCRWWERRGSAEGVTGVTTRSWRCPRRGSAEGVTGVERACARRGSAEGVTGVLVVGHFFDFV